MSNGLLVLNELGQGFPITDVQYAIYKNKPAISGSFLLSRDVGPRKEFLQVYNGCYSISVEESVNGLKTKLVLTSAKLFSIDNYGQHYFVTFSAKSFFGTCEERVKLNE